MNIIKINVKKVLITSLIILEIISLFLVYKTRLVEEVVLDDVKLKISEPSNNGFALMLQQDDGTYQESTSSAWPKGMLFNSEKSGCVDVNNNIIEDALSFDTSTNSAKVKANGSIYCYLYFDKDKSVYGKVVSDYTNGNGVKLLSDSDKGDRDYDTYYYYNYITNNNVLYGGFCWKMVITTENNGVKMIYNGEPQTSEDGTISCDNTGDATVIGQSAFNSSYKSPAYVGYMYNKVYTVTSKSMSSDTTEYVYGNTFTYSNGTYTLSNTTSSSSWSSIYETGLNSYHYTCFNTSGTCSSLNYICNTISSSAYYITLTGGKSVEDALNEMLYAEDVNTTDSTIKGIIDSWYESKILETYDGSGNLYSNYLQNTIYCNNRTTTSLGAFNPNDGSNTSSYWIDFNYNTLDCANTRDQFTLSVDNGGTEGYGNNALKYPIGLISYKEAKLARGSSSINYLNNSSKFWLLTPSAFSRDFGNVSYFSPEAVTHYQVLNRVVINNSSIYKVYGVRPAITLNSNVEITLGDGSYTNPYQVKLSS